MVDVLTGIDGREYMIPKTRLSDSIIHTVALILGRLQTQRGGGEVFLNLHVTLYICYTSIQIKV